MDLLVRLLAEGLIGLAAARTARAVLRLEVVGYLLGRQVLIGAPPRRCATRLLAAAPLGLFWASARGADCVPVSVRLAVLAGLIAALGMPAETVGQLELEARSETIVGLLEPLALGLGAGELRPKPVAFCAQQRQLHTNAVELPRELSNRAFSALALAARSNHNTATTSFCPTCPAPSGRSRPSPSAALRTEQDGISECVREF